MATVWTVKKQLFFLALLPLFVALVIVVFWFVLTRPTCFDNKQNQDEEGVDCGGPCAKKCLGDIRDLNILWVKFFEVGKGKYDVAAMVNNPNSELGIPSIKYYFRLVDKKGDLIIEKQGETFITPGENFPLFLANIDVGLRLPSRAFLEFEENPQWVRAKREKFSLIVSRRQFFNNPPFPRLIATLENKDINSVYDIFVAAVLYDNDKNARGVSITKVDSIAKESSQEVIFTWPQPLPEVPETVGFFFKSTLKQQETNPE
jgi:hypothetical protein